ncbi:DUF1223 domain-containing protein [Caenimonas aquaedulcis]|uniref:DUF1223 domain-containing protein n=1 Tax=Caenimonas aquaedulcis TaxID=2793270 RepID=A0A931MEX6_9BURK|nr:DUF1223 domain-containing protein [Caenimonas aquaedulcis]MBG9386926.1 DUF1223 domain-containing protein [Caenimonas aquaedulcis]
MHPLLHTLAGTAMSCLAAGALAATACRVESPANLVPVIELYTSEGCSSCPPADRWLSSLKPAAASGRAVVQAFHVGYWDYIGWADRFASPAHTQRQREVSARNGLTGIYTPQLVRNGRDFKDYAQAVAGGEAARARIELQRLADDAFEATVSPAPDVSTWSAYWTVTENGHSSKVKAGENQGEFLQHDFVVRQYVQAGDYRGGAKLTLRSVPASAGHPRQVNLVVFDPRSGRPLQALSLGC